jgi:hypothetical protein
MKTQLTEMIDPSSYIGIDYHKRYSVYCVIDPRGGQLGAGRINHATPEDFCRLVERWPGSKVAFEASMNCPSLRFTTRRMASPAGKAAHAAKRWHWLYEILETVMPEEDIVLANPFKTRIIAEAQIKTDKIDARALADLLRANLISSVHVPARQTRRIKDAEGSVRAFVHNWISPGSRGNLPAGR